MTDRYFIYSDEDLLHLIRSQNDELAFGELYRRHARALVYTALRKTGSSVVAEDLVQELFVKLWLSRHKVVVQKNLAAYLNGMLRNHVITYYYQEQKKQPLPLENAESISDEKTSEQVQFDTLNELYQESLQKLPQKCREVFVMSRKGYSLREIAQTLQISEKTVEAHISKALRILRVEMKDYIAFAVLCSSVSPLF